MGKGNLIPFSPTPETTQAGLELSGESRLEAGSLLLIFNLKVSDAQFLMRLVPSAETLNPLRQDELWKATCFEAFISKPNTDGYFEFNGSANGAWNLYEFDSYRTGMREVSLGASRPPELVIRELHEKEWRLGYRIPLAVLQVGEQGRVGEGIGSLSMTAVLKSGEHTTYWAFKHPGAKPDFHLRESFCDDPIRN
jgi:hypothetical protein